MSGVKNPSYLARPTCVWNLSMQCQFLKIYKREGGGQIYFLDIFQKQIIIQYQTYNTKEVLNIVSLYHKG